MTWHHTLILHRVRYSVNGQRLGIVPEAGRSLLAVSGTGNLFAMVNRASAPNMPSIPGDNTVSRKVSAIADSTADDTMK
jgi:hypothetical protein